LKKKIQFILNKPQLSENIGMSIRSIGCFGFKDINLVNPRNPWPNEKGLSSSKHFSTLAKSVKTFSSIPEAIKKSDLIIATTVRQRDFNIPQIKIKDIKKINAKNISILFGQENNGLNNQEISYSNYILTLPTLNKSSLNLSHTISVVAYELSQLETLKFDQNKSVQLKSDQIENFLNFLMKTLKNKAFTTVPSKRQNLEISIRNFLKTSKIDEKSLKTAYGILKFITK
jgi:tRNA/rRNA methyltransferase